MNIKKKRIVTTLGAYLAGIAIGIPCAGAIELELIGRHAQTDPELFDESAAEIPTYDPETQRVFVTNAATASIDVIDLSDPADPALLFSIPLASETVAGPTSLVFTGGVLAVSLAAEPKTDNGVVAFYNADGDQLGTPVEVGALPDAITVSPDGTKLIVSNEGEPNDDNTIDPDGSVSIIDISAGIEAATVATADFSDFNSMEAELRAAGVRIFGRVFTDTGEVDEEGDPIFTSEPTIVSQDLEPEFAAVSPDGATAYVTLQENNASRRRRHRERHRHRHPPARAEGPLEMVEQHRPVRQRQFHRQDPPTKSAGDVHAGRDRDLRGRRPNLPGHRQRGRFARLRQLQRRDPGERPPRRGLQFQRRKWPDQE